MEDAGLLGGSSHRAKACAFKKDPVVLMSSARFHSFAVISTACEQPTTLAKQ